MLYMGYVGFAVAFAFAITALIDRASGQCLDPLDPTMDHWRPGSFLTIGITLGSWWAYNELGWGGWWFWDPVENASFMPWLVGTALIHSLAVTEKARHLPELDGAAGNKRLFALSLLGTFLVRSGVLVSVHAFATDPARGIYILLFFRASWWVDRCCSTPPARRKTGARAIHRCQGAVPRGAAAAEQPVFLVVSAAAVLLGTLYPLVADALGLGRISVGPPYFNSGVRAADGAAGDSLRLRPARWPGNAPAAQVLRDRLWLPALAATVAAACRAVRG